MMHYLKLDPKTGSLLRDGNIIGNIDDLLGQNGKPWTKTQDYVESAIPEVIGQKFVFGESGNSYEDLKATPVNDDPSADLSEFCRIGNSSVSADFGYEPKPGDRLYISCAFSVPGNIQGVFRKTFGEFSGVYLDGQILPVSKCYIPFFMNLDLGNETANLPCANITKSGFYLGILGSDFSEDLRGKEDRAEIIVQTEYKATDKILKKTDITFASETYSTEETETEFPTALRLSFEPLDADIILPGIRIHHLSVSTVKPNLAGIFGKKVRYLDARGLKTAWNLQKEWITAKISENVSLEDKEKWNAKSDFSGSYDDLTDKPNLKTVALSGNYNDLSSKPSLSAVALSGNYNDLINKPSSVTVPENVSAFVNDSGYATEGFVSQKIENLVNYAPEALDTLKELSDALGNDPNFASTVSAEIGKKANTEELSEVAFSGSYSDLSGKPDLKAVATSGSYSDLTDVPLLKNVALSGSYSDLSDVPELADVALSGSYSDLSGTPILSAVALSGKYSDLSGKPDLKTVATSGSYSDLTGKPNLANIATSGNYDDLINVPAKFEPAEHNHDSRYYTSFEMETKLAEKSDITHDHDEKYLGISAKAESAKSADSVAWNNVSGRPTAVSSFTNDSGYITSSGTAATISQKVDASAKTHTNYNTNGTYVPTMNFLSYWNGSYSSSNASNLTYCAQGTIIGSSNIGSQSVNYANSAGAVAWDNVSGKPSSYNPSAHTHDDRYYTESEVDSKLGGKSDTSHNHNSVYLGISAKAESAKSADSVAWTNVSGKPSSYTPSSHTHDDRYYTETEVNNLLAGKANSSHTHSYISTSASCNKNWNWSGQGGQPSWLWGGNDGTNMYVYNPSNFSVNYANSAGSATYASRSANNGGFYISGYLVTIE